MAWRAWSKPISYSMIPDQSMFAGLQESSASLLGCRAQRQGAHCPPTALPPAHHILDQETERGRQAAREFFEEWLDCSFEFHELIMVILHNIIVSWEDGWSAARGIAAPAD
jgi:hypothetical protein